MNWTPETYTFLATSASTTLSFVSTTAGAFGPAIDNVVITETVPTKSDCKDGGWQAMIDNAGNHFKNQGDCVSYFATGGKNLGALPPVDQHEQQRHDRERRSDVAGQALDQGTGSGHGPACECAIGRKGQDQEPSGPTSRIAIAPFEIAA